MESMPTSVRHELISALNKGFKQLIRLMDKSRILTDEASRDHRRSLMSNTISQATSSAGKIDINIIRNSLKSYVYLTSIFMTEYSKLKESKENQHTKQRNKRPDSRVPLNKQRSTTGERQAVGFKEMKEQIQETLEYWMDIVRGLDIQFLWKDQKVEEDMVKLLVQTGFDMLENPNNTKISDIRESLFAILQQCMERFGSDLKYMQTQNSQRIIELIYNYDFLDDKLADFVSLVAEKQGPQMANEVLRELTTGIREDKAQESASIKNIGSFLRKLSKRQPKLMYQNISTLLSFFECESYLLRQAVIKILANVVQHVLSPTLDNAEENDTHTRVVYA